MLKVRNRLLILLALLTVGLVAFRGIANATTLLDIDGVSDPTISPYTGEPDQPSVKKTSMVSTPGDAVAPRISRALWFEWATRIWMEMHLNAGR
jgi:hypothetical protein